MRPEPHREPQGNHFDHAAERIARRLGGVDAGDHCPLRVGVEAADGARIGGGVQALTPAKIRNRTDYHPSQLHHVTPDLDAELFQQDLAYRAAGDSRHRFARARPLQDVARVPAVVLERAREIGVAGAGAGPPTPAPPARGAGLPRPPLLPAPPAPGPPPARRWRAPPP